MALPSALYVVQDNLVILALSHLDAPTFTVCAKRFNYISVQENEFINYNVIRAIQVTYQARILTTAFFAKLMLKKQLTAGQWSALVILTAGVCLAQVCAIGRSVGDMY